MNACFCRKCTISSGLSKYSTTLARIWNFDLLSLYLPYWSEVVLRHLKLVEETGVSAENPRPTPSHWQLYHIPRRGFEPRQGWETALSQLPQPRFEPWQRGESGNIQWQRLTRMKRFMHEQIMAWKFIFMGEKSIQKIKFLGLDKKKSWLEISLLCIKIWNFHVTIFSCMNFIVYG